jgi:hypothetical protein
VGAFRKRSRVLIISRREEDRDTIRVLVGTMGCQWVLASDLKEALDILNKEETSAVILDSRCAINESGREDERLNEILLRLPGRVIVLADERSGVGTSDLVRKLSLPLVQRDRITQDLWVCLEALIRPRAAVLRITEEARLILDTLLQSLPAGIRYSQLNTRQLVYDADSLTTDISLERVPASNSILLVGQIMWKGEPELPCKGVAVVLQGQEGPLGLAVTNESGEFSFEFKKEPSVAIEIEDRANHCVTIISPGLDWDMKIESQSGDPAGREPSPGATAKKPAKNES